MEPAETWPALPDGQLPWSLPLAATALGADPSARPVACTSQECSLRAVVASLECCTLTQPESGSPASFHLSVSSRLWASTCPSGEVAGRTTAAEAAGLRGPSRASGPAEFAAPPSPQPPLPRQSPRLPPDEKPPKSQCRASEGPLCPRTSPRVVVAAQSLARPFEDPGWRGSTSSVRPAEAAVLSRLPGPQKSCEAHAQVAAGTSEAVVVHRALDWQPSTWEVAASQAKQAFLAAPAKQAGTPRRVPWADVAAPAKAAQTGCSARSSVVAATSWAVAVPKASFLPPRCRALGVGPAGSCSRVEEPVSTFPRCLDGPWRSPPSGRSSRPS
mmetsp:Transcript_70868/g.165962  ORF Transcript_70868/g.165962 Transcript_70868/m.165962 type:complete len:329 (-) Transcript_70868:478-1464(-)